MLPMKVRVQELKVALTVKLAQVQPPSCLALLESLGRRLGSNRAHTVLLPAPQDDLHIVDSLELPTADPQYLTELAHYRHWGDSVLLVDL